MPFPSLVQRLAGRLDLRADDPIAHQIVEEVWTEVVDGTLETGARMPTVRELAIELGVSPRSVKWAYAELERLGVLSRRAGEGTFVSLDPPSDEERRRGREFLALCGEMVRRAESLGYGVDDLTGALTEYRAVERDTGEGDGSP
jgi:DNA-binding transcriptional regulator YhcF (GntR family)